MSCVSSPGRMRRGKSLTGSLAVRAAGSAAISPCFPARSATAARQFHKAVPVRRSWSAKRGFETTHIQRPYWAFRNVSPHREIGCRTFRHASSHWELVCRAFRNALPTWELACRAFRHATSTWEMLCRAFRGTSSTWEMLCRAFRDASATSAKHKCGFLTTSPTLAQLPGILQDTGPRWAELCHTNKQATGSLESSWRAAFTHFPFVEPGERRDKPRIVACSMVA